MSLKVLLILVAVMLAIECTITPPFLPSPSWPAQIDDGDHRGFGRRWGRRCSSNNDCGWERICVLRRCVPRPTGCSPACSVGQFCNNRVCQWPGNNCHQWCRHPRICFPNGVCDYPQSYCVGSGRICSSNEICYENRCVANDGCYGRCVHPQYCFNGQCRWPGNDGCYGRCVHPQYCYNGECRWPGNDGCFGRCIHPQYCFNGQCRWPGNDGCHGRCVHPQYCWNGACYYPDGYCGGIVVCPIGFNCINSRCQKIYNHCGGCPFPTTCVGSICRRPCPHCLPGEQCFGGYCYQIGSSSCISSYSDTCPSGYSCRHGSCGQY